MIVALQHPHLHSYAPGKNPMELVSTSAGRMERWRADALLLGETSAAIQARHDAVSTLDDLEKQKRELAAGQAALAIERATFDAEKRAFADQAATLAGRLSVEWDRLEKLRADQLEEPLVVPPGTDQSKEPEPPLELEDAAAPGTVAGIHEGEELPSDPAGEFLRPKMPVTTDQAEFPTAELPTPPVVQQPIAAGLDEDIEEEENRGD